MRLVGPDGPNMVEGRVEYCSNGLWGTVSYDSFDTRDGEVVCRRLGYRNPSEIFNMHNTCIMYILVHSYNLQEFSYFIALTMVKEQVQLCLTG